MPRVILVQVVYNHRRFIPQVFEAVRAQSFRDFKMVAVIAGNEDGSKEFIAEHYPEVEIIDPGYNIGFAKGHNLVFAKYDCEFFQLVNPDLILAPNYLEEMVKVFDNAPGGAEVRDKAGAEALDKVGAEIGDKSSAKIGAATGKLLLYDFEANRPTGKIDTTGVIIQKSGRARDRGQHEADKGQYDNQTHVMAVSGAGAMFRKVALEAVKMPKTLVERSLLGRRQGKQGREAPDNEPGAFEYFDEDFHSYWEDVDLSWRLVNAGYVCRFAPQAVAYHGRGTASSEGGYKKVGAFIKHHKKFTPAVRRRNYKNHIFMYLKNAPRFSWNFFAREFFMLGYIILFETSTLKVIPELFRLLPPIWRKRKYIQESRKIAA